jgi:hypothetical protein
VGDQIILAFKVGNVLKDVVLNVFHCFHFSFHPSAFFHTCEGPYAESLSLFLFKGYAVSIE